MVSTGDVRERSVWADLSAEGFRNEVRSWLREVAPTAPADYGPVVPEAQVRAARGWQRRIADAEFAGLHWPMAVGGQGLSRQHTTIWIEECAHAGVPPYLNMVGLVLAAEALLAFGTESQQHLHLPELANGRTVWAQLFSEPGAGSDLAHVRTVAKRTDEGWCLSGEKVWTSNGHSADWAICLARTDPGVATHRGLSFFLVHLSESGVDIRPLRQMTGRAEFDQVFLQDVQLPEDALIGPVGGGWSVTVSILGHERDHVGASVIALQHRLASLLPAALGGSAPQRQQAVRLWTEGQALLRLGQQRARLGEAGASLMKLGVTRLGFAQAELAAHLAGPAALLTGQESDQLLEAPAVGIAGGTTEVQKTIVGERLLGLPREPQPR